ncbi:ZC21A protein, partial [Amia calva]|nr:ZC21A protein [Amia calva]
MFQPPKKQSNWRRKHEDFIATIRAAKGLTQTMKEGGPLPPPPPPSYDPDYIQCPCCQRRFGENAAERHIKFCKEQAARITNKSKFPADAKGKPPAKTQYKPLAVKKTNSPAAPISASSRLPQRSSPAQTTGDLNWFKEIVCNPSHCFCLGIPSNRTPSAGPIKNNALGYSPSRTNSTGLTSPQSGYTLICSTLICFLDRINMKSKPPTSPGSLKNTSGIPGNRRKVYNADSYASRNEGRNTSDVDYSSPLSGGGNKGSDGNFPSQLSKFCHECGTKHPVEWAKFCCECGVRRMCI